MSAAVIDPNHRPLGLATDVANTNFVGATNPDAALHVRFYSRPVINNWETNLQGHPIFEDRVYVEIMTPGNQLNIIDRPLREEDKSRFPMHWAHWNNTHGADGQIVGTPLSQWPLLTAAQAETLKYLKFFTVESIALCSDQQLQSMGIGTGVHSPVDLRNRARTYLQVAKDESFAHRQSLELQKRDELIAEQGKQLTVMQAQMAELLAKMTAPQVQSATVQKRKYTKRQKDHVQAANP